MAKKKGIAIIGATGGLGEAVAMAISKRAPVTVGYASNEGKAREIVKAIRESGGSAQAAQIEMQRAASVQAFIDAAVKHWDELDAIVSVTGPLIPLCELSEVSEEDFKRVYDIDVFGSFNILKYGGAALKTSGGGAIVLTLTTAVLRTLALDGMSGGPKTAVAGMIKQAARE